MKFTCALAMLFAAVTLQAATIRALIIDGQNNHDFKATTPHLKKVLEETGLFTVDVATSPAKGGDMSTFKPKFSDYKVIISNYNGEPWSKETQDAFVAFVRGGGGFVSVHAADNAFPNWKEYNEMIAVGGWEGRNEKSGPYLRFRDDKWVYDKSPGVGGSHGAQHSFVVETRVRRHPIVRDLPMQWMHAKSRAKRDRYRQRDVHEGNTRLGRNGTDVDGHTIRRRPRLSHGAWPQQRQRPRGAKMRRLYHNVPARNRVGRNGQSDAESAE
jgi:hypothetical protein